MIVTLSPEMVDYVAKRIGSGDFQSPSEVIGEALLVLRAQEEYRGKKSALITDMEVGFDDIKAGRVLRTNAKEIAASIRREPTAS
jgi:putative addiction module CopG family antidote